MTNKFWTDPCVGKGAVIGAVIGLLSASPDSVGAMVAGELNGARLVHS
jgi:hypothetical protein